MSETSFWEFRTCFILNRPLIAMFCPTSISWFFIFQHFHHGSLVLKNEKQLVFYQATIQTIKLVQATAAEHYNLSTQQVQLSIEMRLGEIQSQSWHLDLKKWNFWSWYKNWDSKTSSLGLSLDIETFVNSVSVSVWTLRLL